MVKRWGHIAVLALGLLMFQAGQASAVPVIDGTLSLGEWDAFIVFGSDPNEAAIPDSYDIASIRLIQELGGAPGDDGLYALLTTYGAPSLVDLAFGPPLASISFLLNYNGDADFTDAGDRLLFHTALGDGTGQTFEVRDGTGALLLSGTEGTHFKLGSVAEYFVPFGSGGSVPIPSSLLGEANYDNGGTPPDDRLPDTGFFTPIPEPSSMLLLGLGLVGGVYRRRRAIGL